MALFIFLIVFIVCTTIQVVYYFVYLKFLSRHKIEKRNNEQPKISVLICAHNEEEYIEQCIKSYQSQEYPNYEIIVVNDRSTDCTRNLLNQWGDGLKIVDIKTVDKGISPKKNALTKGFNIATGEFVFLTDADCVASSSYLLQNIVEHIKEDTELVLGFSPYRVKKGWLNKLIQFDTYFTAIQYLSFALKREAYMGVGRNLLIKRDAFFRVNGFNGFENVLAGDDDIIVQKIANRKNVEICLKQESFVVSEPEKKWLNWFNQKRRHLSVGVKYKNSNIFKIGLFQQSFVWMYLSFFTLISLNISFLPFLSAVLFIRSIFFHLESQKKLKLNISLIMVALLEILYFFHFLLIGTIVLIRNKNKW